MLDYGCGDGKFSRAMSNQGAKVVGVDISKKMLELARKNSLQDIEYYQINSGELNNWSEFCFDSAVMNFVTCEISDRKEIIKILKAINRVLKWNSCLVILNVNWEKSNGKEFVSFKLDHLNKLESGSMVSGVLKSEKPIRIKDYFWSKGDYLNMLEKVGFRIYRILEPIVDDGTCKWINEKQYPPFLVLVAQK